MKKSLFVIMLVVLCLFSFVSCEKDKSGEMVDNYVAFKKIEDVANVLEDVFSHDLLDIKEEGIPITSVDSNDAVDLAEMLLGLDDGHYLMNGGTAATASGTLKGTGTYDALETHFAHCQATFENVELNVCYQEMNEKFEKVGEAKSVKFSINGSISYDEDEKDNRTYGCNLTINGDTYNYSYSYYYDSDYNLIYTAATINGNPVEPKLLNSNTYGLTF